MERFSSLLYYLEGAHPLSEFVIRGKIPCEKTPLVTLNTIGKASRCEFVVFMKKVADIMAINQNWVIENGVTFDTISWTGGSKMSVNTYLNMNVGSIHVSSADSIFINKIEEYAHQVGFRVFTTS